MNVKLGGRLGGGVMLILGSHGTANAEDCFRLLADKLAVPRDRLIIRSFETSPTSARRSLSNTKRREDPVEDILRGGRARDGVDRPQRAVEIQQ